MAVASSTGSAGGRPPWRGATHFQGAAPLNDSVLCSRKARREGPLASAKPVAGHPPVLAVEKHAASARRARRVLTHYGVRHAFIMSLRRKTDRRDLMRRQLDAIGIDYTFVDAVDGVQGNVTCFGGRSTSLGGGNAAMCGKQSFLETLRVAMRHASYPVLVTEDDVDFRVRWPTSLPLPPLPPKANAVWIASNGCLNTTCEAPGFYPTLLNHTGNSTARRRFGIPHQPLGGKGGFWGAAATIVPHAAAARALELHMSSKSARNRKMRYIDTYVFYAGLQSVYLMCPPLMGTLPIVTSFEASHDLVRAGRRRGQGRFKDAAAADRGRGAKLASSGKSTKTHHRRPPWPVGTFNGGSSTSAFTDSEPTPLISFSPPVGQLVGNVALAVGWGPSQPHWDKYRLSLASLAAAAPTTTTVLFSNVDAPALMRVPRVALPEQLLILNVSLPSLQHAWQFRSLNVTLPADSTWWRMPLFASFLVSHCRQADTVFWFDLKDVVFQLSPFELVPKAQDGSRLPTIVSALEPPGSFRRRQWNFKAAAWHLGKLPMDDPECSLSASAMCRQLMRQASPAVNLGLVLAPPVLLARQAHRIARMVLKVLLSGRVRPDANGFGGFGIDQGAHILLAYGALECHKGRNNMSTAPPHWLLTQTAKGAGKVLTFGGHAFLVDAAVFKLDAAGFMRSSETGARYAVIHQYDRHPASLQRALWCCRFPSLDIECAGRCTQRRYELANPS